MLNPQEKQARLTNLLARVQNNRSRVGQPRTAAAAPAVSPAAVGNLAEELKDAEAFPTPAAVPAAPAPKPVRRMPSRPAPAPLVAEPTSEDHEDDDIDFGLAEPHEAVEAATPIEVDEPIPSLPPEPEPPAAESIAGALDSVIPDSSETVIDTKQVQGTRSASADALAISGERPKVNWSIQAVLDRAWKFGEK